MKNIRRQIVVGVLLIMLSALLGVIHYEFFHDARTFLFYMALDVAFIPVQVFLVTLIISNLLAYREKRMMLNKLNMVIGAFFSEVGSRLLKEFSAIDPDVKKIAEHLCIENQWDTKDFANVRLRLQSHHYTVEWSPAAFESLRTLLTAERSFLLRLLENQNLLEHESFTDLLWAVFHLTEELSCRTSLHDLPETDSVHLIGDTKRAYRLLLLQWLDYTKHLKNNYPYLFSLAIRTNPFNPAAAVTVMT
ncbi:MAG: hypothetical protein Q7T18_11465 [Sedimentisphaerales bacterium]|nr:hypothetical protein [Sedimentisphaerales bacterium]